MDSCVPNTDESQLCDKSHSQMRIGEGGGAQGEMVGEELKTLFPSLGMTAMEIKVVT